LLACGRVTRTRRTLRLAGPLWALGATCACIWPQPVNEEPPPSQSDQAPVITFLVPPPPSIRSDVNSQSQKKDCIATVRTVQAITPLGLPLTARFYLNYPAANGDVPLHVGGCTDAGSCTDLLMQGPLEPNAGLVLPPVIIDLGSPDVKGQLNRYDPNILWLWVSDGFSSETAPTAMPTQLPPYTAPVASP